MVLPKIVRFARGLWCKIEVVTGPRLKHGTVFFFGTLLRTLNPILGNKFGLVRWNKEFFDQWHYAGFKNFVGTQLCWKSPKASWLDKFKSDELTSFQSLGLSLSSSSPCAAKFICLIDISVRRVAVSEHHNAISSHESQPLTSITELVPKENHTRSKTDSARITGTKCMPLNSRTLMRIANACSANAARGHLEIIWSGLVNSWESDNKHNLQLHPFGKSCRISQLVHFRLRFDE